MSIDVLRILDILDRDVSHDLVVRLDVDQVLDGPSLGGTGAFWNFENPHPEAASVLREDEQPIVVGRREDLLDEILVAGDGPLGPHSTAGLLLVFVEAGSLDVAGVADGDDHLLVRNHVLDAQFGTGEFDAGAALVAELLLHFQELVLDDAHAEGLVLQDGLESADQLHQLIVLGAQFVALESGQLLEAHVEDGPGLDLAQLELLHQAVTGVFRRLAAPDEGNDLIQVVDGNDEPLQDVGPLLRLAQFILGPAHDDIVTVLEVVEDHLPQVQQLRTPLDQGNVVDREAGLELRVLVQLVEDHVRDGVPLEIKHDPHALPVGLVPDLADAVNLLVVDEVSGLANHVGLVDLVGNLLDNDLLLAGAGLLETGLAAHHDPAAAGLVGILHPFHPVDDTAGGEVWSLDVLHQPLHGDVRLVDHRHAAIDHLRQVVGRHVGRHADRDACGTVDEEVGNLGREHRGLLQAVIEVVGEVDGLLVEIGEHLLGNLAKAGLRVPHGRRVVSVD